MPFFLVFSNNSILPKCRMFMKNKTFPEIPKIFAKITFPERKFVTFFAFLCVFYGKSVLSACKF
jgi:hypothetical protein